MVSDFLIKKKKILTLFVKCLVVGMVENPWKPENVKELWHFWVYMAGTPLEAEEFFCEFKIRGHRCDDKLNFPNNQALVITSAIYRGGHMTQNCVPTSSIIPLNLIKIIRFFS